MPWSYDTAYVGKKSIYFSNAEIVNIGGTKGMTCNNHVFSPRITLKEVPPPIVPPSKEKIVSTTPLQQKMTSTFVPSTTVAITIPPMEKDTTRKSVEVVNSKGKEAMNEQDQTEKHKKDMSLEESQDFLKLIRKSDFKIM